MFKIVQITDLHLSKEPLCHNRIAEIKSVKDAYTILKARIRKQDKTRLIKQTSHDPNAVKWIDDKINELNPDFVFITGDISTSADMLPYAKTFFETTRPIDALTALQANSTEKNEHFTFLEKCWILPGNHDKLILPNNWTELDKLFKQKINNKQFYTIFHKQYRLLKKMNKKLSVLKKDNYVFVFYDFTFTKKRFSKLKDKYQKLNYFLGAGIVTNKDINRLEKILKKYKSNKIIFVSHYPIIHNIKNSLRLFGACKLKKLLKAHNVQLIISGHTHKTKCSSIGKDMHEIICGTSSACDEKKFSLLEYIFNETMDNVTITEHTYNSNNTIGNQKIDNIIIQKTKIK